MQGDPGPLVTAQIAQNGTLAAGATGQVNLVPGDNNAYISANVFVSIVDVFDNTAYFQVKSIDHYNNTMVIENLSDNLAAWGGYAKVTLIGPRGFTGSAGATGAVGPTGSPIFTESGNDISYTSGTTTLSKLTVQSTDYNRLPMGMLSQTQMGPTGTNYTVASGTTFPTNVAGNLIGSVSFTPIGPTGPRRIKTHITLNVEDSSQSTANSLYLSLYDGSTLVNRFRKTYRNGSYANSINFYHYSSVSTDSSKTYSLYGSSSTASLAISGNTGTYDSTVTAPPSFITIEDIGNA